jgi:hypothetical protein
MKLTPEQIQGVLELEPNAQIDRLQGERPYIRTGYWNRQRDLNGLNTGLAKLGLKADEIDDYDEDTGWLYWYELSPLTSEINEVIEEFGPDAKDEMSPADYIKFLMDKFYEYRTLAADPTITDQATKLYLDKASEYYARAQEAMDEIEPDNTDHLSDEDKTLPNEPLSDKDKAMIDKYEDEEANREINKMDADMYRESKNNNKMNEVDLNRWTKLAGINEGMDAASLIGKYITLSQNVGMSGYHPKTAQEVIDIMPKFTNPAFGIKIHDTDPGRASFGNAVYLVQQDGSLKMVSNNYDTSG